MKRSGHQSPPDYDAAAYPAFAVTVDVVILTMSDHRLHVLLVRRSADPYAGRWALPGGFKRPDESLDEAVRRELREETGVTAPAHLAQLGAYGDPGRDPRGNIVTVAYWAVVPSTELASVVAGGDAESARLWPLSEVIPERFELAFDHRHILTDAFERAGEQLEQSAGIATAFVGPTFTLPQLQKVYEELWETKFDAGNFRKSLASRDALERLEARDAAPARAAMSVMAPSPRASSDKGGRPPDLYRASEDWQTLRPLRRPRPKDKS